MSKRKKILKRIGISALVAAGLYYCIMILIGAGFLEVFTFRSRFNNLIYKTDHHALLAACRKLMDEGYSGKYNIKIDRKPEVDNFPEIILQLKPTYLWFQDEGYVIIELFGGMSHYGVRAYAEDFNEPYEGFRYGNKKLIDGLWFESDFIDLSNVDLEKKRRK
jgi:hypothetical protein